MSNQLYYGDNLPVLKESVGTESVDLIYLDPPFNSNANYNVLFKAPSGRQSAAQIEAFKDTWHWTIDGSERMYDSVMTGPNSDLALILRAIRNALGENDLMAYLAMMAARLNELYRVLKPTGTMYLHCDPTASHYLKMLLDATFGPQRFVNELIWKRTSSKSDYTQGAKHFPRLHDTILVYSKTNEYYYNQLFSSHDDEYIKNKYPRIDANGRKYGLWDMTGPGGAAKGNPSYEVMGITRYWRYSRDRMNKMISEGKVIQPSPGAVPREKRYLDDSLGVATGDIWTDISPINSQAQERLGYPTQKPVSLLERIINSSSRVNDVVLDPFCGCGTAVHAAQKLGRRWIGIDITHLAVGLIERRLKEAFPGITFEVNGVPTDIDGAKDLAKRDKHEFQKWITGKIGAQPYKGGKKGMDRGIDGFLHFRDADKKAQFAVISVKGGKTNPGDVRDLKGTIEREKAVLGLFLTLNKPTREMSKEAASAGFYETGGLKFPKIQILTAEQIIAGNQPKVPFSFTESYKTAPRERDDRQENLF